MKHMSGRPRPSSPNRPRRRHAGRRGPSFRRPAIPRLLGIVRGKPDRGLELLELHRRRRPLRPRQALQRRPHRLNRHVEQRQRIDRDLVADRLRAARAAAAASCRLRSGSPSSDRRPPRSSGASRLRSSGASRKVMSAPIARNSWQRAIASSRLMQARASVRAMIRMSAPAFARVDGGADPRQRLVSADHRLAFGVAAALRRDLILEHDRGEPGAARIPAPCA